MIFCVTLTIQFLWDTPANIPLFSLNRRVEREENRRVFNLTDADLALIECSYFDFTESMTSRSLPASSNYSPRESDGEMGIVRRVI